MSAVAAAPATSGALPVADVARAEPAREAPPPLPAAAPPTAALALQASPTTGVPSAPGAVDLGLGGGPAAAGLLLAALAVAALVLARRRHRAPRVVEILESASLGPRRALVVARLGEEVLLLGSSEGGISLLSTRPAAEVVRTASSAPSASPVHPASEAAARQLPAAGALARLVARAAAGLRRARPAPTPVPPARRPAFESLLAESVEDAELRRKLAEGGVGSVR